MESRLLKGVLHMKNRLFMIILLSICALMTACREQKTADAGLMYTPIDQDTAREMMEKDDGHIIVDVRSREEYDTGHIPGAIPIPNENIGSDMPEALPDPEQTILVYCRSGNRSRQAAEKLGQMGYTNVYEFGGVLTWKGALTTDAPSSTPAVLSFSSFDGGGYEYTVDMENPDILAAETIRDYGENRNELEDGATYRAIITLTGLRPGRTIVHVHADSPIAGHSERLYTAMVDGTLRVTLKSQRKISSLFLFRKGKNVHYTYRIHYLQDGYYATVNDGEEQRMDTASADALMEAVEEYDVMSWDGFHETKAYARKGESFWIELTLTDGTHMQARGDDAYPEHYLPAMNAMHDILTYASFTPVMSMDDVPDT